MEDYSLERLYLSISNEGTIFDGFTFGDVETGFDIKPKDYLKFAESDLTTQYDHHLVNSLSNTKRAIDSQLDSLLIGFGLSKRAKREKWAFPKKIEFLNSIGIISPRILKKINKRRNLLEHEYKNPNEEEVEDALDVASLFVAYTDRYLFRALEDFKIIDEKGDITLALDWENCKINFIFKNFVNDKFSGYITEELTADHEVYDEYLKFYLKLYNYL